MGGSVSIGVSVTQAADYQGEFTMADALQVSRPLYTQSTTENTDASNVELTVSGVLAHKSWGLTENYIHYQDMMGHTIWEEHWDDQFDDDVYSASPQVDGVRPENRNQFWYDTGANKLFFEWRGRNGGQWVWIDDDIPGTPMAIHNRAMYLAIKFNSDIGYIPLFLLPYLSAGKHSGGGQAAMDALIKPVWAASWNLDVADAKQSALTNITQGGTTYGLSTTDDPRNFSPTKSLYDAIESNVAMPAGLDAFQPYTFQFNVPAVEAAFNTDGTNRLATWEFAIISAGLDMSGTAMDGYSPVEAGHAFSAYQLSLTHI